MRKNGSDTGAYSSSASSHSDDDVFGFALDVDNGKAYVHKNGTYYASGNPATGANPGATWTPATEYTDGFTPYFTVLIALLLVSKVPTLSLKRISISPKGTVFLLLTAGIIFIALLFYTFETLLFFSVIYLITIPVSVFIWKLFFPLK